MKSQVFYELWLIGYDRLVKRLDVEVIFRCKIEMFWWGCDTEQNMKIWKQNEKCESLTSPIHILAIFKIKMYSVKCQEKILSAYFHSIKIVQRKFLFSINTFYVIFHDTKNKNWLKDSKFMIIDYRYYICTVDFTGVLYCTFLVYRYLKSNSMLIFIAFCKKIILPSALLQFPTRGPPLLYKNVGRSHTCEGVWLKWRIWVKMLVVGD